MALFRRAKHENLARKLERKGSELSQSAAERGAETSRRMADILKRASEDIRSVNIGDYRERAMGAIASARDRADERAEMARDNIRAHPVTSIMVAMGIGMLAGVALAMMGSRMAQRYEK